VTEEEEGEAEAEEKEGEVKAFTAEEEEEELRGGTVKLFLFLIELSDGAILRRVWRSMLTNGDSEVMFLNPAKARQNCSEDKNSVWLVFRR
jgi:hypothetical protein